MRYQSRMERGFTAVASLSSPKIRGSCDEWLLPVEFNGIISAADITCSFRFASGCPARSLLQKQGAGQSWAWADHAEVLEYAHLSEHVVLHSLQATRHLMDYWRG